MSDLVIKDVCYPRKYIDKQGEEKVNWIKIGTSFEKDGGQNIELYCLPIQCYKEEKIQVRVFERRKNDFI